MILLNLIYKWEVTGIFIFYHNEIIIWKQSGNTYWQFGKQTIVIETAKRLVSKSSSQGRESGTIGEGKYIGLFKKSRAQSS